MKQNFFGDETKNRWLRAIGLALPLACGILPAQAQQDPAYQVMGKDTVCQIFTYSPNVNAGLHLAYLGDDEKWYDVGQLCASDYGQWGVNKKMQIPHVAHAADGTWRAVWGLDDASPCFAVAYSEDLVTWRPQDYPRMSVKGIKEPIIFPMDDGTCDIYFKAANGKHYVKASGDFRKFEEARELSTIEDIAWLRDTATVNGQLRMGNQFDVPKVHLEYIRHYFKVLAADGVKSAESMRDDAKRFGQLPATVQATLNVDAAKVKNISDKLYGIFFEDISYAADGGLWAELLQNGDFEYTAADHHGWNATTAWKGNLTVGTEKPLSQNNAHYVSLTNDTLYNMGWDGIMDAGAVYDFSLYARTVDCDKKQLDVALVSENGEVMAKGKLKIQGSDWKQYQLELNTNTKARTTAVADIEKCQLRIVGKSAGRVAVDLLSLMPRDTYKGHGLRKDLAEHIAALKPRFVRFPGGCMSHGQGIGNIYHWAETVGPVQDRKPAMNIWNYHQSRRLGFYEYFQWCEDMGAEPLPVLAAGVPCQNSQPDKDGYAGQQGGIDMKDMPAYCQEFLNLIEWANGDPATSRWAKMRAEAGHPAPFNLKMVGVGNEDIISTVFEERCKMIAEVVKAKYPEIEIVGTAGPFHYPSADYVEGWKFAKDNKQLFGAIDEHYYESTGWFLNHQDYYDDYDRTAPKVYLGEYASRTHTHESALAEALYLCHIERNGDVVEMTSYAPLLSNTRHQNWSPDLIYFDNGVNSSRLTPSYHTQRIFANYAGDRYVESKLQLPEGVPVNRVAASVVKDSKTGKTYVKLVNALPRALSLKVAGLSLSMARYDSFKGEPKDTAVVPSDASDDHSGSAPRISGDTVFLQPYSVVAIEL